MAGSAPPRLEKIRLAAENSVGTSRGIVAARMGIRLLLAQLAALEPIRKQLEGEIETLARQLPDYLMSLPGASPINVVSLFGETDPIDAFASPSQLIAFAGLDLVVSESGQYQAPRRHISKRGSPYLRHTLWAMAHRACKQEGDLRNYWLRRKAKGLKYLRGRHRHSHQALSRGLANHDRPPALPAPAAGNYQTLRNLHMSKIDDRIPFFPLTPYSGSTSF